MAEWSRIRHQVDGLISSVSSTRSDQALWTWREAVRALVQDFREVGTPRVSSYSLFDGTNDVDIESNAVRLFGVLVDNSQASTDAWVAVYNTNAPVEGTTNPAGGLFWSPQNRVVCYAFRPVVLGTALTWSSMVGTQAALAAGTLTAANGTQVALVYTE